MTGKYRKGTKYPQGKEAAARQRAGAAKTKAKPKQRYSIPGNMLYITKLAWHSARGLFAAMLVMVAMQVVNHVALIYTDKYVIEFVLGTFSRAVLGILCIAAIAAGRIAEFVTAAANYYAYQVGVRRLGSTLYARLMRHKMAIAYEDTESTRINDMLQKAHTAVGSIPNSALFVMKDTLVAVLEILTFGGILSLLHPLLLPVIGLPAVAGYYIQRRSMGWVWDKADNWQKLDRQMEYVLRAGSDFSRAKDVRIFGMQMWLESLQKRVFAGRLGWYERQDAWEYRHNVLGQVVAAVGNAAADIYVIHLVMQGSIGAGDFVLYFNSIFLLSQAVRSWCGNYAGYRRISKDISYIREYLDLPDAVSRGEGRPVPRGMCEITFKNVSYTYSGAASPTIENISFQLKKGEKLAIVGPNGAGKTTLVKLLCGLYHPTEGEILLNGVPICEYGREEYFGLFSTVFQDISVLPVTVAENIAGAETGEIDLARLCDCMKKAGIYDKVMSLPERENTRLVKSVYDDATEFSGGQMQKLALAKALYKDAPVLLLDEPTAALDPIAEQEMYQGYARFSRGKSSIFISHRLASTRFCDRILLVERGRIAEEGTHRQLMEAGGMYAELYQMQSSYYQEEANYAQEG